jgi:hypothetical protein
MGVCFRTQIDEALSGTLSIPMVKKKNTVEDLIPQT